MDGADMPRKNYYTILGIDEEASPSGIRGAFRDLVKRYHPDRVGPEGTKHFQEILEAYEHLSNPELRRQYNDSLRQAPPTLWRPQPEPLIPRAASFFDESKLGETLSAVRFEPLFRKFTPEALNLKVILSPEEAAFGVEAPIRLPVSRPCPRCDGTGQDWLFPCEYCLETGFIEDQRIIGVRIPPMIRDGSIVEIGLESVGVHNVFLRLHIRVR